MTSRSLARALGFEIARQVIVFEQDAVLERLMPALDLALGHRIIRRAVFVIIPPPPDWLTEPTIACPPVWSP
jgi:hypothetical protein